MGGKKEERTGRKEVRESRRKRGGRELGRTEGRKGVKGRKKRKEREGRKEEGE